MANGAAGAYVSAILAVVHVSKLVLLRSAPELTRDAAAAALELLGSLFGALAALAAHRCA